MNTTNDHPQSSEAITPTFHARLARHDSVTTPGNNFNEPYHPLCNACHRVFASLLKPEQERTDYDLHHHHNIEFLREAAAVHRCPLCRLFLSERQRIFENDGLYSDSPLKVRFWFRGEGDDYTDLEHLKLYEEKEGEYNEVYFETVFTSASGGGASLVFADVPLQPPLALAKTWITQCQNLHHACAPPKPTVLPTRLIDIGSKSTDSPKLVITAKSAIYGPYVALSHCWGKRKPDSCLQKDKLGAYQTEISLDALEQNFRDAIAVTRQLGYRYLWIDTLCIIQDDRSDWQRESVRMEQVYANADLTIAAIVAADAYAGFLKSRPQSPAGPVCQIMLEDSKTVVGKLYIRCSRATYSPGTSKADSGPIPLLTRAWAFQERILSRRVLHFGYYRMVLECREDQEYEGPTHKYPFDGLHVSDRVAPLLPWLTGRAESRHSPPDTALLSSYYEGVEQYTLMLLTYPDDILPAISGIAECFNSCTGDVYLAGLWETGIVRALAWCRDIYRPKMETADELNLRTYRPPSWTWASISAKVIWPPGSFEPEATILAEYQGSSIAHVGDDPFGQVHGGRLTLRGYIVELVVSSERAYTVADDSIDDSPDPSNDDAAFGGPGTVRCKPALAAEWPIDVPLDIVTTFDDGQQRPVGFEFNCLILFANNNQPWRQWIGLALQVVHDQPDTFQKIGLAECEIAGDEVLFDQAISAIRSAEHRTVDII